MAKFLNQDIKVTKAHALALNKLKILSNRELVKIQKGLNTIVKNHSDKKIKFSRENEDIHMNIEADLKDQGDTAKKIHTGRSRNDQVATDTRLWVLESCKNLKIQIKLMMKIIIKQSEKNIETIMPGFTHLQAAQPISFGHHLLAYFEMFKRDLSHLEVERKNDR